MPKLIIQSGSHTGRELDLEGDVLIGRGSMTDLSIYDPTISRRHAVIAQVEDGFLISDLRSGNGTRVNGVRIEEPTPLHNGDEVQLGSVMLRFLVEEAAEEIPEESSSVVLIAEDEEEEEGPEVVQTIDADEAISSIVSADEGRQMIIEASRRLHVIYSVGRAIGRTLDEEALLTLILEKLFEVMPQAERGAIMLYDAAKQEIRPKVSRDRDGVASDIAVSRTLMRDVIENRRGILSADAMQDARFAGAKTVFQLELRSVIVVPMVADEEVYGVIHVDGAQAFSKDDMALVLGIAGQAALSLANARLHQRLLKQQQIEQDMELARKIQHRFLPQETPTVEGYEFCDDYSSAMGVGGDYYDFLELQDGHVGIALGDVSGKGVSAALYMAKLSSEVRYRSAGRRAPDSILRHLNSSLASDVEGGMFVTLVLFVLNPKTGEVKMASAGHLPPLMRRRSGEIVTMDMSRNLPLGITDDADFETTTFQLKPGDTMITFTDGVVEAENAAGEQFGDNRLMDAVRKAGPRPQDVLTSILDAVRGFADAEIQHDDVSLITFGRLG